MRFLGSNEGDGAEAAAGWPGERIIPPIVMATALGKCERAGSGSGALRTPP